jgi:hypothetical protein
VEASLAAVNASFSSAHEVVSPGGFIHSATHLIVTFLPDDQTEPRLHLVDFAVNVALETVFLIEAMNDNEAEPLCSVNFKVQDEAQVEAGVSQHVLAVVQLRENLPCRLRVSKVGGGYWVFYSWEATRLE